ncbi:ADP compounds hydrolase NudE [Endozoicomonas montiporae]|uniref:ADP-ribose diphosphatase NudE n=1 Tax=Endozoicomonas montiporae CL-33 TaxID=570277 RepID=A0A142BJ18_9GAMM|nr:ADP compounds hydrolase NudE [Endozoicomonas montiporae]AMO58744.1 ADP-ribose diphosphatase NudE [Endozoicomonas montiporae CL-33]
MPINNDKPVVNDRPRIKSCIEIAKTRLFRVEALELEFSNGEQRTYERLAGSGSGRKAVMVVPMLDDHRFLLVKEFAAGTEDYQLSLPKGLVELDETLFEGADRELKEEAGFGARQWDYITEFTVSPNYMKNHIHVVLARDLYPERLEGDEPEIMEVVEWSLDDLQTLNDRPDFSEARTLAALYLVRDKLQNGL